MMIPAHLFLALILLCVFKSLAVASADDNNVAAEEPCHLCPDGGELVFPNRVIPNMGLAGKPHPTCEEAAEYAPFASSKRICELLQKQAAYCGCPGAERPDHSCQFCENGEPPEFGEKMITEFEATCDEMADYVAHLTHQECELERGQAILRHGFLCGCPFSTPECPICPDGTIEMERPDIVVPFFNLNNGHFGPTCLEVAEAAILESPASIDCELIKDQAGFCGCKDVEPGRHCHLCPDGGIPERLNYTTETGDTCQNLYDYMEFLPEKDCEDSRRTAAIQRSAHECGCPGFVSPCSLCAGGEDPPDPERKASTYGKTCGEAKVEIESNSAHDCEEKGDNIAAMSARCGCDGAEFPVCTVNQGSELCTYDLLNTTSEDCECYSFCDGEFLQCHDHPGGLLSERKCSGEKVSGCNEALAEQNRLAAEKLAAEKLKAEQEAKEAETNKSPAVRIVPSFMAFVSIWAFLAL